MEQSTGKPATWWTVRASCPTARSVVRVTGIWKPVHMAWPRGFVEAQILIEQDWLEPETLHF